MSDVSDGAIAGTGELLDQIWDTAVLTGATLVPTDAWLLRGVLSEGQIADPGVPLGLVRLAAGTADATGSSGRN